MSIAKEVNAMAIVGDESQANMETVEWHENTIKIVNTIDASDMYAMVDYVIEMCFDENELFIPRIKDFAVKSAIIQFYTNIQMLMDDEDDEAEKIKRINACYDLIYKTDLLEIIATHINSSQIKAIIQAINEEIDNKIKINVDALQQLISKFVDIEETMNHLFDGIDNETITQITNAIAGESFDEAKLVELIAGLNK